MGFGKTFWKTSHTQEAFFSAHFLQRKQIKSLKNDFQQIEKPRDVSTCKKEDATTLRSPQ